MITTYALGTVAWILMFWFLMIKPFTTRGPNGGYAFDDPRQIAHVLWFIHIVTLMYYIEGLLT